MPEVFTPVTGAVLSIEDIGLIAAALVNRDEAACKEALAILSDRSNADADQATRERIAAYQAGQPPYVREGEVEVDNHPSVSLGDDAGAYVQAWIWVSDECAGLALKDDE